MREKPVDDSISLRRRKKRAKELNEAFSQKNLISSFSFVLGLDEERQVSIAGVNDDTGGLLQRSS